MVATILCIGMAGAGKTTFMQRLNSELHAQKRPPYVINLDPAVNDTPYGPNIDIRDSVNYHKVMEDYGLGPNGAIMTSLNLFSTKVDQIIGILEKRAPQFEHVLIDTPGQIECFIWSASGQIIMDSLASSFPTMIAYIVDTPRCTSPTTFMSNMLYACSILYKTKLPMIIVFNKTDAQNADFAKEWMTDFEAFQRALNLDDDENGSGYMGSLMSSMSLVLEEFYNTLDVVSVSSLTGQGIPDLLEAVQRKKVEFEVEYEAEKERVRRLREEKDAERKAKDLEKLLRDVGVDKAGSGDVLSDFSDDGEADDDSDELEEQEQEDSEGIQHRYQEALRRTQGETREIERSLGN